MVKETAFWALPVDIMKKKRAFLSSTQETFSSETACFWTHQGSYVTGTLYKNIKWIAASEKEPATQTNMKHVKRYVRPICHIQLIGSSYILNDVFYVANNMMTLWQLVIVTLMTMNRFWSHLLYWLCPSSRAKNKNIPFWGSGDSIGPCSHTRTLAQTSSAGIA